MIDLDIIVTHYTEPWSVCEKFFAMLDLQRGVDFSRIRVLVVHDGEEHAFEEDHFSSRPYEVREILIPHGGVSAARNAGMDAAEAEWLMFCDCDDVLPNLYALRDYLTVLPAQAYDMLWTELLVENTLDGNFTIHNRKEQNCVFCHGKLYRRVFLLSCGLRFNTALTFNEDSEFNAILLTLLDPKRIGKIQTATPPYVWCWRPDSTTKNGDRHLEQILCHYERNKSVAEAHRINLPYSRYCGMVARTCIDAYYALNIPGLPEGLREMKRDFRRWYLARKKEWRTADLDTLRKAKECAYHERAWFAQEADPAFHFDDRLTVTQWLNQLEREEIENDHH